MKPRPLDAWWSLQSKSGRLRWLAALVFAAVAAVFSEGLPNQFVWDDQQIVLQNRYLTSAKYVPRFFTENLAAGAGLAENRWRPVELLTHFADVRLWGYDPWGHHLTNILIHAAAAAAVFLLLATLVKQPAAVAAALIFSLHPLQTLVVPIVTGRADSLVLLFLCASLLAFRSRPGLSLLFAGLALGSKESGILVPPLLWLFDRARPRPAPFRRHLPFWGLLGLYVIARLTCLNFFDTLNSLDPNDPFARHVSIRLWTYLSTLPMALSLCVWPADVHLFRSWPVAASLADPRALAGAGVLSTVLALAFWAWRRRLWVIAAGLGWFLLATLPTSNLLAVTYLQFSDHWYILPALGLTIAAADALARLSRRRMAAVPIQCGLLVIVSALGAVTPAHIRIWRTPLTLFSAIAAREPASGRAQHNLGMALKEAGRIGDAIPRFERALALGYDDLKPHYQLALCYAAAGRDEDAIEQLRHACRLAPRWAVPWRLMGEAQARLGRREQAAASLQRAWDLDTRTAP